MFYYGLKIYQNKPFCFMMTLNLKNKKITNIEAKK